MNPLTRRSVTAGLGAAVAAIPAVGFARVPSQELGDLIKAHRAAFRAFGVAIDREEAAKELFRKGEPTVDSGLGCSFSLYMGENECRKLMAREYQNARALIQRTRRMGVDIPPEGDAFVDAKEAEAIAAVDTAFADYNAVADHYSYASDAEDKALVAVCSYRCRTLEEVRIKAKYLLTTATVKDTWEDEAKALLKSFE